MKAKVIALFLAGGLMLGMSGCGGSQSTASTPQIPKVEEQHNYGFPAPGAEDVETETLNQVETEETEKIPEEENLASSIDTSSLLTEYVLEYEDYDGYQIRETIQISPIFRESDSEAMYALWEALGGDPNEIPVGEDCFNWNSKLQRSLERSGFSGAQYIVGSREILNCTEGFDFTPDAPRTFILAMRMKPNDDGLPLGVYETISQCSMTYIFFSDGLSRNKSEGGILPLGNASMDDNQWGPILFIIILPDKLAPNLLSGYDCHNLLFDFSSYLNSEKFYIPYYNELY